MKHTVGLILGSGLGDYAENLSNPQYIDYHEIPGFPVSTVPGHKGRFVIGKLGELDVVCMQGRVHYYEGYSMKEVTFPIRYMKERFGVDTLILTNAAGGINKTFADGTLMMLKDHITSFVPSPLIGMKEEDYGGVRFPDMSNVYSTELCNLMKAAANKANVTLREGVYVQTTGPNYETPAEVRLYGLLGADAVGMSTAVEAMMANALGIRVCGISCITNKAAGISDKPLSHAEVQETAARVAGDFKNLLTAFLGLLADPSERQISELNTKEASFHAQADHPDEKSTSSDSGDDIDYSKEIIIYSDGAARGNPDGPGGYGTHMKYTKKDGSAGVMEFSQGYVRTTNNRMEILAAVVGLEALKKPSRVTLYSDSQYLIKTFNDHWIDGWIKKGWKRGKNEPVKNVDLWKRMLAAKEGHEVTFVWVKGHAGNEWNERCDVLATTAADGNHLIVDEGLDE